MKILHPEDDPRIVEAMGYIAEAVDEDPAGEFSVRQWALATLRSLPDDKLDATLAGMRRNARLN